MDDSIPRRPLAFVESQGVSPDRMIDALAEGPAGSGALAHRGPLMASRRYAPTVGTLGGLVRLLAAIRASAPKSRSQRPMTGIGHGNYARAPGAAIATSIFH